MGPGYLPAPITRRSRLTDCQHCRYRSCRPCHRDSSSPPLFLQSRNPSPPHGSSYLLHAKLLFPERSGLKPCQADEDSADLLAGKKSSWLRKGFQWAQQAQCWRNGGAWPPGRGLDLVAPACSLPLAPHRAVLEPSKVWLEERWDVSLLPPHSHTAEQSQPWLAPSGFSLGECCGICFYCCLAQEVSLMHNVSKVCESKAQIIQIIIK